MLEVYDLTVSQYEKERNSLSFYQCGIEHCESEHFNGPRIRLHMSIHIVLEGKGYLVVNKKRHTIQARQIFLVPANVEAYYCADYDDPWKYCWIDFFGADKEVYLERIFGKHTYVKDIDTAIPIYKLIDDFLDDFYEEGETREEKYGRKIHLYAIENPSQLLKANAVLYEVLALILEEGSYDSENVERDYVQQIKNYIDNHFLEIEGVIGVAEIFHLHPNYLSAVFKQRFHVTMKKYLLNRKINYADYLLSETDYTVQRIASICGFSSVSSFGKIYKKYKGKSPGEFRKSQ